MTSRTFEGENAKPGRTSWWPMVAIALGQAQLSWNANALPVLVGAIGKEFGSGPSLVVTAIVVHALGVAGFTMLGARLGQKFGSLRLFRWATGAFVLAMVLMATSWNPVVLVAAQVLAGLSAAAIIPALVVLTAQHYSGQQRATALGVLGAVQAIATVVAFFVAGVVGTHFGWRWSFALLVPLSLLVLLMSRRLQAPPSLTAISIDRIGVVLAAGAVILISLGFDLLEDWGWALAKADSPVHVLGLSPAPIMIVCGLVGVQFFIAWTQRREAAGQVPLLPPSLLESRHDRAALVSLVAIAALGKSITFLIPLYMQVIQGRTSLETAVAMIPHQFAVLAAAILVVRLYGQLAPPRIARRAFAIVILGTLTLALTVRNDWNDVWVVGGLLLVGLGQGALATLLFHVLVSSAPAHQAGDVGALRGTVSNLAGAVGTALTGALVVGLLGANVQRALVDHPELPPKLISQVPLDNVTFVSNELLRNFVERETTATPTQVEAALRLNTDARLSSLKLAFLLLSLLALFAIVPAGRLADLGPQDPEPSRRPPAVPRSRLRR